MQKMGRRVTFECKSKDKVNLKEQCNTFNVIVCAHI